MSNFWELIDRARGGTGPMVPSADSEVLQRVLENMKTEEVMDFAREFARLHSELNTWKIWGAGYVIAGGMGDDSFDYFRSWIIGKGKDCFEMAVNDPEGLGSFVDDLDVSNESLGYVADSELEARGVTESAWEGIGSGMPKGEEDWDDENAFEKYPRLSAQFG